jgi:2-iminobutanoate/2-iminopropanoate deaminase
MISGEKVIIITPEAPAAVGPYSQAIKCNDMIFCSGQIPLDPASGNVVGANVAEQTERVLLNLRAVLEVIGSGLHQVVKTTVYLKSMQDFAAMNAVYAKYFEIMPPARATVEVARLPKDVLVEIDCIAVQPGRDMGQQARF